MRETKPGAPPRARHDRAITLAAFCCAPALASCGSSSRKPAAKSRAHTAIAFSKCMREHGVTDFPDPGGGGGGINLAGTGINPNSPAFRSAQAACFKLIPGAGPGTHASEQQIKQDTEMAKCMRDHGVMGFPEPIVTATPPAVGKGEYSAAEYGNGIFIGIPKSINVNSPAFEAAAKACNFH
jgi:hypothetical protein